MARRYKEYVCQVSTLAYGRYFFFGAMLIFRNLAQSNINYIVVIVIEI